MVALQGLRKSSTNLRDSTEGRTVKSFRKKEKGLVIGNIGRFNDKEEIVRHLKYEEYGKQVIKKLTLSTVRILAHPKRSPDIVGSEKKSDRKSLKKDNGIKNRNKNFRKDKSKKKVVRKAVKKTLPEKLPFSCRDVLHKRLREIIHFFEVMRTGRYGEQYLKFFGLNNLPKSKRCELLDHLKKCDEVHSHTSKFHKYLEDLELDFFLRTVRDNERKRSNYEEKRHIKPKTNTRHQKENKSSKYLNRKEAKISKNKSKFFSNSNQNKNKSGGNHFSSKIKLQHKNQPTHRSEPVFSNDFRKVDQKMNLNPLEQAIRRKKHEVFQDYCEFWNAYSRIPKEELEANQERYEIPLRCRVNPMTDPDWQCLWLNDGWHTAGPIERRELNRLQIEAIREEGRIRREWKAALERKQKRKLGDLSEHLEWSIDMEQKDTTAESRQQRLMEQLTENDPQDVNTEVSNTVVVDTEDSPRELILRATRVARGQREWAYAIGTSTTEDDSVNEVTVEDVTKEELHTPRPIGEVRVDNDDVTDDVDVNIKNEVDNYGKGDAVKPGSLSKK